MKFAVLLAAVPVLCMPAAGSPLRAPENSLPPVADFDAVLAGPGYDSRDIGFDPDTLVFTADAYRTPHPSFAPLPEPRSAGDPEIDLTTGLDARQFFGPPPDQTPDPLPLPVPLLALLSLSSALGTTEPTDLLFLITGLTGISTPFLRRARIKAEKRLTVMFRRADRPRHRRVRIQQRKMAF